MGGSDQRLGSYLQHPYLSHVAKSPSWRFKIDAFALMIVQGARQFLPSKLEGVETRLSEKMFEYDSEMWEPRVKDFLRPVEREVVLDIGAGYGRYLRYLTGGVPT